MPMPEALADVRRVAQGPMRRLFLGLFVKSVAAGLTLSLLVVYLHLGRDFSVKEATVLLAWQAVLVLVLSPLVGTWVDRFGPRPVLLVALLVEAAGLYAFGQVTTPPQAFLVMSVVAAGAAGIWGPTDALIARLVPSADRSTAFGFSFMLFNLGLGLGGLISATIIDTSDPRSFELLYQLTALGYLAMFLAVLSLGPVGGVPEEDPTPAAGPMDVAITDAGAAHAPVSPSGHEGWAQVLRDRALLRYAAIALLLLTFGYGGIEAGAALFITTFAELDDHWIGVTFAVNTTVIVVAQLFVLKLIKGQSRSLVLVGVAGLWAVTWLLFASALGLPEYAALAMLLLAYAIFGIGETMWSPVAPALLNDLAPEHLRGRYNSFQSFVRGVSDTLGPLLTGLLLGNGMGAAWALLFAGGCALAAVIALRLPRLLTPVQDGRVLLPDPA